jgi:outer membrane biogenesis lipoprotein LolB
MKIVAFRFALLCAFLLLGGSLLLSGCGNKTEKNPAETSEHSDHTNHQH